MAVGSNESYLRNLADKARRDAKYQRKRADRFEQESSELRKLCSMMYNGIMRQSHACNGVHLFCKNHSCPNNKETELLPGEPILGCSLGVALMIAERKGIKVEP